MGLLVVEIIMEIEARYWVHVSDAQAQELITVGDLYTFVCSRSGRPLPQPEAWLDVRDLVARMTEVDPEDVLPDTRLSDLE